MSHPERQSAKNCPGVAHLVLLNAVNSVKVKRKKICLKNLDTIFISIL